MTNAEMKKLFKSEGIFMWQIAQALGIHEMTFSKWFRNELPKERQKEVMAAVAEIKKKRIESEEKSREDDSNEQQK